MNKPFDFSSLSPATLAGLSQIKGGPLPGEAGNPIDLDEDPDDPTTWKGVKPVREGETVGAGVQTPEQRYEAAKAAPVNAQKDAQEKALADATPQGPAEDVKTYGEQPIVVPYGQAGGRTVPAHWQPGTQTLALQHGMSPEELEPGQYQRDVGAGLGLQANDLHLQAAQRAGQADAMYAAAHAAASQRANERMAALEQQRQRYVDGEKSKLDQLAVEAQAKVDPNKIWDGDRGGAAKVMAGIMMGLNQFAVMWRGKGTNTAMQIVNDEMNRSIDAQKANIANAHAAYNTRSGLYARNLQEFGDRERAILATKINYLDAASAIVDQQKAIARTEDAQASALDMQKRIAVERAGYYDEFAERTHTKATEQMNAHFVPTQTVGGGTAIGQKGMEDLYVPGHAGYARTKDEAVKLREHDARTMVINSALTRAQKIIDEANTVDPYSIDGIKKLRALQGELDSISNEAAVKKTVNEGQGAQSKGDKEVSDATLGILGTKVWSPAMYAGPAGPVVRAYNQEQAQQASKVISATKERAIEQNRDAAAAAGIISGREVAVQQPNGSYERRAMLAPKNKPMTSATEGYDDVTPKPKGTTKKE